MSWFYINVKITIAGSKEVGQGTKTTEKARSTPNFGQSLFEWAWYLIGVSQPKFQEIWRKFCHLWIFYAKHRFSPLTGLTPRATLHHGNSIWQKLSISRFFMQSYTCSWMDLRFGEVLGLQKVKKLAKNDFLPLFWIAKSSLGRFEFWQRKWTPNSKIPVGLESRLTEISNKPTLAQFGHLQVPQKWLQRHATRQAVFSKMHCTAQKNAVWPCLNFWGRLLCSLM